MAPGSVVSMANPVGVVDRMLAKEKEGSYAIVIEFTKPRGYVRIRFLCDPEEVHHLVHPESLVEHPAEKDEA